MNFGLAFTAAFALMTVSLHAQNVRQNPGYAEKVYLQTDRSCYLAGDTLRYKAYVVDGNTHIPIVRSKTVYVNLTNSRHQNQVSQRLFLATGQTSGSFRIPDTLSEGAYQLSANTNWMRNTGEAYFFRKIVWVFSLKTPVGKAQPGQSHQPALRLRFTPESGQLVQELRCRLAYQLTDSTGRGIMGTGVIKDDTGQSVADFSTEYQGTGTISLIPQPGRRYIAEATANGQTVSTSLPAVQTTGYGLVVNNQPAKKQLLVQVETNRPGNRGIQLLGQMRGQIYFRLPVPEGKPSTLIAIPYDTLWSGGILRLTLLDSQNHPLAERLAYVGQRRKLLVSVKPQPAQELSGDSLRLFFRVTDEAGHPVSGTLAVSVTDSRWNPDVEVAPATLASYLWLAADLPGYVEQPTAYLSDSTRQRSAYLDYLMMLHSEQFLFRQSIDSLVAPVFPVESGLVIRGRITDLNNLPVAGLAVKTVLKTSTSLWPEDIRTNKHGQFALTAAFFADTATVLFRPASRRSLQIHLDGQPATPYQPRPFLTIKRNQDLIRQALNVQAAERLRTTSDGQLLNEVTVKGIRPTAEKFDSRRVLYGEADYTVKANEVNRSFQTIAQMIQGQVAGVLVDGSGRIFIRDMYAPATIMVDGMVVDASVLSTLTPADVDAIDILKNTAASMALGTRGGGGGINVLTRRGPDKLSGPTADQVVKRVAGYGLSTGYYSPTARARQSTDGKNTNQATLYWNASLCTDASGETTITVHNAGGGLFLRVVAEVISADGRVGTVSYTHTTK